MKKSIVLFYLERRLRQIDSDPINHVALAQKGMLYTAYTDRRKMEKSADALSEIYKMERIALESAIMFVKMNAPDEMPVPAMEE